MDDKRKPLDLKSELEELEEELEELEREEFEEKDPVALLIRRSLAEFLSLAVNAPVTLASILLQVQHCPRLDSQELETMQDMPSIPFQYDDDSESSSVAAGFDSDLSSEAGEDTFKPRENRQPLNTATRGTSSLEVDDLGYITRPKHSHDALMRPRFEMPPLRNGIWTSLSQISAFRHEGFFSMWKITFPLWLHDTCVGTAQPVVEDKLNEYFDLFDLVVVPLYHQRSFWPNFLTRVVSSSIVRFAFSPICVLAVYLAVQTSDPLHAPYRSTWHAFKVLMLRSDTPLAVRDGLPSTEADGVGIVTASSEPWHSKPLQILRRMYPFASFSFLAIVTEQVLQTAVHLVLRRYFLISPTSSPVKYGLSYFLYETLSLLLTIPMKTIMRRLWICGKKRNTEYDADIDDDHYRALPSCVRLVDRPYSSPWNCMTRIVSQEAVGTPRPHFSSRSVSPSKHIRRPPSVTYRDGFLGGVAQLYRGFWFNTYLNVTACALYIISNTDITSESDYLYF
eukprot:Partr_v1_DN26630_c0_g1_i1_m69096 putative NA